MIRRSLLNQIIGKLERYSFSANEFVIDEWEDVIDKETAVSITYRFIEEFKFKFTLPQEEAELFQIERKPGKHVTKDTLRVTSVHSIMNEMDEWLVSIREEMKFMPFTRDFEETKERLAKMEKKFDEVPKEYFSREEGDLLKQRLEEIELKFEEQLKEELDGKEELQKELDKMKADMKELKFQVDILDHRGWLKSFGTKIYNWGKTYPKTTAILLGATVNLLPEGIRDIIPQNEIINAILPEAETPELIEAPEPEPVEKD